MSGDKRTRRLEDVREVLDMINQSYGAYDIEAPMVLLKRLLRAVPEEVDESLFALA